VLSDNIQKFTNLWVREGEKFAWLGKSVLRSPILTWQQTPIAGRHFPQAGISTFKPCPAVPWSVGGREGAGEIA
jgi:hypothetical protein